MSRKLGMFGLIGAVALTACSDPEVVLTGERLSVRDVLQSDYPDTAAPENSSLAFSAGPATRNSSWAQSAVSPHTRVAHAALGQSLTLAWATEIGAGDSRRKRLNVDPVFADNRIYVMDSEHVVRAVSTDGTVQWSRDITPSRDDRDDAQGGGLAYGDGRLYVASGFGLVTALDPATGEEIWTQRLGGTATGAPSFRDGVVYVISGDQIGWALEADSGRVRWQIEGVGDSNNVAGAPAPAVSDKHVLFSFGNATVQAAFRKGGLRLWNADILGRRNGVALTGVDDLTGDPAVVGDRVYAGNYSGRVVALSLYDGERLWTARQGALGPVWAAGGSVFFVSDRNQLVRLDADTGTQIWAVGLPGWKPQRRPNKQRDRSFANFGPIMAGGRLIVASSDGQLRGFDPRDGAMIDEVEIPSGATTRPIVVDNTLYVVSKRGQLLAYR